ncbi:MAG: hypothetical protein JHC33_02385 [Ignisphaera sp.]|nr:hypothetical protein [Ignisphaera sp.]
MSQIDRQIIHFHWFNRIFLTITILIVAVLTYWTIEPDPLQVNYVDGEVKWSKCTHREYSFDRYVRSDKDLIITVQERWHDIDGMMNYNGIEGEYVFGSTVTYTLGAGFNEVMTFNKKVPKDIPIGRYEYRPWATYKVNPIKTITRLLPVQYIEVVCEAKVCEANRRD